MAKLQKPLYTMGFFFYSFFIVTSSIFLVFSKAQAVFLEYFDEPHIKTAILAARDAYRVADVVTGAQRTTIFQIETPLRGDDQTPIPLYAVPVRPFAGETGHIIGLSPDLHAIGAVYRSLDGEGNLSKRIYIAFHGSRKVFSDWITDFNCTMRDAFPIHGFSGFVHCGFSLTAESSYDSMVRQIRTTLGPDAPDTYQFIFCGHSLGAATSTIAAREFKARRGRLSNEPVDQHFLPPDFPLENIRLITFSSPRVGTHQFAESFKETLPFTLRFFHQGDIVEKVPPTGLFGFKHVGEEVKFLFGETTISNLASIQHWPVVFPGARQLAGLAFSEVISRIPWGGNWLGTTAQGTATAGRVAFLAGWTVQMMHLVPHEEVIIRAYHDQLLNSESASFFSPERSVLVRWFLRS